MDFECLGGERAYVGISPFELVSAMISLEQGRKETEFSMWALLS
jgi:hypothetical protein